MTQIISAQVEQIPIHVSQVAVVKNPKLESNFESDSYFAGPQWSKISNLSQSFKATQMSAFGPISCFVGVRWYQGNLNFLQWYKNIKFVSNFHI